MARIAYRDLPELSGEAREVAEAMRGYGEFENQLRALAHRPSIMVHLYRMMMVIKAEQVVSRRHSELAVVAVSLMNRCDYCIAHHAPMLAVEGMSAAGIERLLDEDEHPELDEAERALVAYTKAVTVNPARIEDRLFERLRQFFTEAQIVELTWRISLCGAFNRFNDALQLEIEPGLESRLAAQ